MKPGPTPSTPRSIGHRLRMLVLITVLVTLGVGYLTLLALEVRQIRASLRAEFQTLAEIVADRAEFALAFQDREAALEHLKSLAAHPSLERAAIADANGDVFAEFRTARASGDLVPVAQWPRAFASRNGKLETVADIRVDGKVVGRVYLCAGTERLTQRVVAFGLALGGVLVLSVLVAFLITGLFQRPIIEPIRQMARAAQAITSKEQYDLRVDVAGDLEVQMLGRSFNDMISAVQDRHARQKRSEQELEEHRQNLEELVAVRSAEAEGQRAQLRAIVDSTSDFIWSVDARTFRMSGFNNAVRDYYATVLNHELKVGERPEEGLAEPFAGYWRGFYRRALEEGPFVTEYLAPLGGRALLVSINLVRQGEEVAGISVFAKDITERKRNEDLLRETAAAAEAATRAKSEFLANMSHEIRTPMNAVLGMTHLALQTDLSDQQRDYLMKAKAAADSLLGIINDVLDFSKIEAGKLEMDTRPFLLEEVFEHVTHVAGPKAAEKRLELMLDTGPEVPLSLTGDPLRLGQVLLNLCGNAIKFTESGEIIVVTATRVPAPEGAVSLQFSVRDTGIGMTEAQTRALFRPFSQVDASSTRRFAGTGLGLAISRRLVEMMGGEIWVESRPGKGSTFYFTATFGLGDLRPRERDPQVRGLGGLSVLIVDDSPNAREILKGLAQGLGYKAAAAASAEEGLAELRRAPYDLVLLDWRMPDVDGFEAARRIRAERGLAKAPRIIMVTAYGDEDPFRRAGREGLDGYLTKPVTPSTLFDAVVRAFGKEAALQGRAQVDGGPSAEDRARLRGARVLMVEDNEFNQQVGCELLGLMGVEAVVAANGLEGLQAVRRERFDAVLMDLQMPVMDGYEATREIRRDPAFAHLPILAMTAHAMVQERQRCLVLGMNDFITKPIDPDRMAGVLAKWVRREAGEEGAPGPVSSAPEADPPGPRDLPGISWQAGVGHFSGLVPLYEKMLKRFLELHPGTGQRLRSALDQGDLPDAARSAHSMISGAGTIGAQELSATAKALEDALRAGEAERAAPLVAAFEAELAKVRQGLQAYFRQGEGA